MKCSWLMKIELNLKKKFRIRETLGLSTNAESSAHTKTDGIFYRYIFFGGGGGRGIFFGGGVGGGDIRRGLGTDQVISGPIRSI